MAKSAEFQWNGLIETINYTLVLRPRLMCSFEILFFLQNLCFCIYQTNGHDIVLCIPKYCIWQQTFTYKAFLWTCLINCHFDKYNLTSLSFVHKLQSLKRQRVVNTQTQVDYTLIWLSFCVQLLIFYRFSKHVILNTKLNKHLPKSKLISF